MEDPRPDVVLHIEDIRQILERFGYEVSGDNINAIIQNKTLSLASGIRTILEGLMHPEMEERFRILIETYLPKKEGE